MSFDTNLAKVTSIGVFFLVILALLNHWTFLGNAKEERVVPSVDCSEALARLDKAKATYRNEIDDLNAFIRSK